MCQDTFMGIVSQLVFHIICLDISMWPTLTLEKWVAIASLNYITSQFILGNSMAIEVIWELCLAIQIFVANHLICLINPQEVVLASDAWDSPSMWGP
ncbi:hypothetical protein Y1Q_0017759 [Alligator mississippiensis]|uniref:Uncharacterized protein n=1 Tax=Alligator mississippiensis TaxID=8496 RepID=A0A151MJE9_ALLMI|nr:hypothetical protein Y1Q_0017759 [Alligator mississippiensis]